MALLKGSGWLSGEAKKHNGSHEEPWLSMLPILSANGCLLWTHPLWAGPGWHHSPAGGRGMEGREQGGEGAN